MAGGKLTPRQKMINLMYLVFIAMLALNMSKEVLSAFGILNNKIIESNSITDARNQSSFEQLAQKAADQPGQYGAKKAKVEQIRKLSKDFNDYIEGIKTDFTKEFERDAQGNLPYEAMDKGDMVDERWFEGDRPSKQGQEFLTKISTYVSQLRQIGGSSIAASEMKKIENRFATNPVKSASAGTTLPWLEYNYKGFPLIATVTKLSQLQADIKTTESDIINGMFQSDLIAAASLTAYQPIVVLDKTAYFQGEAVTGKVILGKFDPSLQAKSVVLNGQNLKAEAGQAKFSFGAGAVGDHEMSGSFNFEENGKLVPLPIKGNYVVVPRPNSANISADKMNVVYRGLPNPMTISFAGISDDKVSASAPGLSRSGKPGQYNLNPGSGTEVTVSVTGKLPDGKGVSDKKTFRIKNIPGPMGAIGGTTGTIKGSKSRLEVSEVSAVLPDFLYDLKFQVTQFTFKVPGQAAIVVNGSRVDGRCKAALAKVTRGDQITISDIKTKIVGVTANVMTGKTAPVIYEIQ
ncbi:MAG TPA: gliding motility protein GldM [Flavobacterium sp.]|jgi:gliding motility-associated protein GldM